MKIFTLADIPDDLAQAWLQHMRDFDVRHAGKCSFSAFVSDPNKDVKEMRELLNLRPPLTMKKETKG